MIWENIKGYFLVEVRMPEKWIGNSLDNRSKELYLITKNMIHNYLHERFDMKLMKDIHYFINWKVNVSAYTFHIHQAIFEYLRVNLLLNDEYVVRNVVLLMNYLLKNSTDHIAYFLLNQRIIMKTLSIVGRRMNKHHDKSYQYTKQIIFDHIQEWAEFFYSRRSVYPNYYETYLKLSAKHGIICQRMFTPMDFYQINAIEEQNNHKNKDKTQLEVIHELESVNENEIQKKVALHGLTTTSL